jgi:hypothetical protein
MKDTLVIAFAGGTYGSYLEWVLTTLATDVEIIPPFEVTGPMQGNSHNTELTWHLVNMDGFVQYMSAPDTRLTARIHPKTKSTESLIGNIEHMLDHCTRAILLYPSKSTELLCINNYFQKIDKDWWAAQFLEGHIDPAKVYNNWPTMAGIPIEQTPVWIRREFLSHYLLPAWHDQIEWGLDNTWHHDQCLIVYVDELLFDFSNTIDRIQKFWGKPWLKSIDQLVPYHEQMIGLQLNIGQDQLCKAIVASVCNTSTDITWEPLPLASQVWIQATLRELGFDIHCDGLDEFPSSSDQLRGLLYSNKS